MIAHMACLADREFSCHAYRQHISYLQTYQGTLHGYGLKTVLSKSCLHHIAAIIKNMKEAAEPASEESGNADDFNMLAVQK